MKKTYAVLFALLAFAVFAPLSAMADTWGDQINDPTRFVVVDSYGGAAVLDRETGLVWEQSPDSGARTWLDAQRHCNQRTVGNRSAWRLPTVQELASLVDPSVPPPLKLPAGHPFSNLQVPAAYWSATTFAGDAGLAWLVFFGDGLASSNGKTATTFVWCVRGGQGTDAQ